MKHGLFFGLIFLLIQTSFASLPEDTKKIDLDIQNQWKVFIQTEADSFEHGVGVLSTLYEYQLEHKIDAMPSVSRLLLSKLASHNLSESALEHPYMVYAKRFDPYTAGPYYFICQNGSHTDWLTRISQCFEGLIKEAKLSEARKFYAAYGSHILNSALLCTIFLILVFFLIKYIPFLFQYGSAIFPWLSPLACGLLFLTLMMTLSLSFGWVLGLTLVTWFLWKFIDRLERYTVILLYLCTAVIPFTFEAPAQFIQFQEQTQQGAMISATQQQRTNPKYKTLSEGKSYQHFMRTIYPRTFYRSDKIQLYISLSFAVLILFLLGMFNNVGDYFFIYQKRHWYEKKLIMKDLQAYPKLYFNFIKKLQRQDFVRKVIYYILPPFAFFDTERPVRAFACTLSLTICFFGWFHHVRFFEMSSFPWDLVWMLLFFILLICLWLIPTTDKNRELYDKKK